MTWLEAIGYALLVTATMATVDYAHARYALAMVEVRRGSRLGSVWWRRPIHDAARWSVVQWGAAAVGFVVAVRVSMWFLPFEAAGLYIGTVIGGTRVGPQGLSTRD